MPHCHPSEVLHCNYDGKISQKWIWPKESKNSASELHFARSYQGHPFDHILVPKHAYLAKYAYLGE